MIPRVRLWDCVNARQCFVIITRPTLHVCLISTCLHNGFTGAGVFLCSPEAAELLVLLFYCRFVEALQAERWVIQVSAFVSSPVRTMLFFPRLNGV